MTQAKRWTRHSGFTLMETLVSLSLAAILMAGIASAMLIALRTATESPGPAAEIREGHALLLDMTADIQYAQSITDSAPEAITGTVPDRNGDGNPETIRYFWSGTTGDTLMREYNGGAAAPVAQNVHGFRINYHEKTLTGPPGSGANQLTNPGTESGTTGWEALNSGGSDLESHSDAPYAGEKYIWVKNRNTADDGIAQDVSSYLENDTEYYLGIWVKTTDLVEAARVGLRIDSSDQGTQEFAFSETVGTNWSHVSGTVTPTWTGTLNSAKFFVNTALGSTQEFKIDEAEVSPTSRTAVVRLDVTIQIGSDRRSTIEAGIPLFNAPGIAP